MHVGHFAFWMTLSKWQADVLAFRSIRAAFSGVAECGASRISSTACLGFHRLSLLGSRSDPTSSQLKSEADPLASPVGRKFNRTHWTRNWTHCPSLTNLRPIRIHDPIRPVSPHMCCVGAAWGSSTEAGETSFGVPLPERRSRTAQPSAEQPWRV